MAAMTPARALRHPTWTMGAKITIDSATLANKGLEVIEAHWLYDVGYDAIEVVIHPQSVVHSAVRFVDGSIKAQLGTPDMRLPIQYALTYPDRRPSPATAPDLAAIARLDFRAPDEGRFPALRIAREAGRRGPGPRRRSSPRTTSRSPGSSPAPSRSPTSRACSRPPSPGDTGPPPARPTLISTNSSRSTPTSVRRSRPDPSEVPLDQLVHRSSRSCCSSSSSAPSWSSTNSGTSSWRACTRCACWSSASGSRRGPRSCATRARPSTRSTGCRSAAS